MNEKRSQVSSIGRPQPRTWKDYEDGCVGTFRGGHEGKEGAAFVHGMRTVFRLLTEEFPRAELCQRAPDLLRQRDVLLKAVKAIRETIESPEHLRGDEALVQISNLCQEIITFCEEK